MRAWCTLTCLALSVTSAEAAIRNQNTGVTYATIQAAVNAAAVGHVILIDAGTYAESVTINKSLTIQRNGAGTAIIDPVSGNGFTISGASVTLRDLRITGAPGFGVLATGGTSHHVTLERVEVLSNGDAGVHVEDYLVVQAVNSSYSNNGAQGLYVLRCGTVQISGVTAAGNADYGVSAATISNALNIATSSLTGNGGGPLQASNSPRAAGLALDRVTMGAPLIGRVSGFTSVTVSVTGVDDTTNDAATVTQNFFSTIRNGVGNQNVSYTNLGLLTVNLYGGNDTINVFGTNSPVTVSAGDGNDTIRVGSNANTVDDLAHPVSLFGGPGDDTATVLDQGSSAESFWIIEADNIRKSVTQRVNYNSTLETVQLNAGTANDVFQVSASTPSRVNIDAGAGDDTVNFANGVSLGGGTVRGRAGHDWLDYSEWTTPVKVSLSNDLLLQATMSQANEVPPSGSPGSGGVLMVYTTLGARFDMRVGVNGIAPASITGLHIHSAAPGVNGPIVVDLDPLAPWQAVGSSAVKIISAATFPSSAVAALNAGNTYVNVHTSAYPAGAIRGQLSVVVPANSGTGTGGVTEFESVEGGAGNDVLLGSDGDNTLRGQAGNDAMFGRGGSDRLHGDGGDDLMFGDGGDDVVFWFGDGGNDTFEGGAGTDFFHMTGHPTANDALGAFPSGNRMVAQRTNLTPYTNDLGGVDYISLIGHGGDDFLTVSPPLPNVFVAAQGNSNGSSGDTLRYNAGCAAVREDGTSIIHPTLGTVGRIELETTLFENRTTVTPEAPSFASAGGNGVLTVTTGASCQWNTATPQSPFIQVTAMQASGSGSLSYRVIPNVLTSARTGYITVAGATVPIAQNAAGMSPMSPFDLNGDGGADLLLHHTGDGTLAVWFMNERVLVDGTALGAVPDLQWQPAGMGDFNGDGKIDILWQRQDDGRLAVWLMDGTTRLDVQMLAPDRIPPPWKVRAVGDMNGDGKADLIIQNPVTGEVGVWFMNGLLQTDGRLFNPPSTSPDWVIVGAADLNADGKRDVVFQHNDGTLAVWFMDGATRLDAVLFSPSAMSDPTWRIKGIMDVNVDGHADLLMQHPDGRMAAFLLNGVTLVDGLLFVPATTMDPAWRLVGPR